MPPARCWSTASGSSGALASSATRAARSCSVLSRRPRAICAPRLSRLARANIASAFARAVLLGSRASTIASPVTQSVSSARSAPFLTAWACDDRSVARAARSSAPSMRARSSSIARRRRSTLAIARRNATTSALRRSSSRPARWAESASAAASSAAASSSVIAFSPSTAPESVTSATLVRVTTIEHRSSPRRTARRRPSSRRSNATTRAPSSHLRHRIVSAVAGLPPLPRGAPRTTAIVPGNTASETVTPSASGSVTRSARTCTEERGASTLWIDAPTRYPRMAALRAPYFAAVCQDS